MRVVRDDDDNSIEIAAVDDKREGQSQHATNSPFQGLDEFHHVSGISSGEFVSCQIKNDFFVHERFIWKKSS